LWILAKPKKIPLDLAKPVARIFLKIFLKDMIFPTNPWSDSGQIWKFHPDLTRIVTE
jgi:hypothetical protein